MTLVPAVLALLGAKAWWLPRRLDRILPDFDVEGEAIRHELELATWPGQDVAIAARGLRLDGAHDPIFTGVDVLVPWGGLFVVESAEPSRSTALLLTLAGRVKPDAGDLKVVGEVLPNRLGAARRRIGLALLGGGEDPVRDVQDAFQRRARLVVIDGLDSVLDAGARFAIGEVIDDATERARSAGAPLTLIVSTAQLPRVLELLPTGRQAVSRIAVPAVTATRDVREVTAR